MGKKIFITVGEVSGDMNASHLVRALRELDPGYEFVAIGGEHLRAAGARIIADSSTWGSIGFLEGVIKGFVIFPVARRIARIFSNEKPDLFVPVDYRVFNMRAARIAKALGIPIVYYFAPVSWFGTGGGRFAAIAETIDLSLVTLPLSLEQYREAGARFEFTGHPLADVAKPSMTREAALEHFGMGPGGPVVGLMPGSRGQEVKRLMPIFAKASAIIREAVPDVRFAAIRATSALDQLIHKHADPAGITVVNGNTYDFMNMSDVLLLCSGTAAHEATLMLKPMVICYKLNPITAWIARKTVNPPMIGLPNILSGEFIAPELVQEQCTPRQVAKAAIELLQNAQSRNEMIEGLDKVRSKLGEPGALRRAAVLIHSELNRISSGAQPSV